MPINPNYVQKFDPNIPGEAAYLQRLAAMQGTTQAPRSLAPINTTAPMQDTVSNPGGVDLTSVMSLLKRYQTMGNRTAAQGEQEQVNRAMSTQSNLIGAAPTIQDRVRNASVSAVEPTIGGARSLVSEATSLLKDYQDVEEKNATRAQTLISSAIASGATGLEELLRSSPEIFKKAGYDTKSFEAVLKGLKAKEVEATRKSQSELTTYQRTQAFNSIVGKYNSSPLVQASDRTPVLKAAVDAIKKDPKNGALQLNLSYAYIQALDTYQSAVREGELSNLNSIDSRIGEVQGYLQKIQNGQIVRPDVALKIADAAAQVVNTIASAASSKAQSFGSQAQVAGIGDMWTEYVGGFTPSYSVPAAPQTPAASDWKYVPPAQPTTQTTQPRFQIKTQSSTPSTLFR